mmetsp:Transcript_53367/g.140313  ORF Transcript_53367/g.140313 Transcript_53367/m.140313 type:complete len:204 (-) Transcript_53367:1579-2190(-)
MAMPEPNLSTVNAIRPDIRVRSHNISGLCWTQGSGPYGTANISSKPDDQGPSVTPACSPSSFPCTIICPPCSLALVQYAGTPATGSRSHRRAPRSARDRAQSLPAAYSFAATSAFSMLEGSRAAPCARADLPPPLPPHGASAALTHSLASILDARPGGTTASAFAVLPLPSTSTAFSGTLVVSTLTASSTTLLSAPTCSSPTT